MFNVKHKQTGEIRTVYGWNGTQFLFYRRDDWLSGGWYYDEIERYEPMGE